MAIRFTAGIDEAGRGPIAGPVCVGMVVMRKGNEKFLKGIKDSKKLSEKKREEWFEKIKQLKKEGKLDFCYKMVSNKIIDKKGIINIGGPTKTVLEFAKKFNPKVKKLFIKKNNRNFPLNPYMNLEKLKKLIK